MIERVYSISLYISTQWCQRQIKIANFVSIFTTHIFSFTSKYIYVQQTLHMKLHIMCAFIPCHNFFEIKSSTTSSAAKTVTYRTLHFLQHDTASRQQFNGSNKGEKTLILFVLNAFDCVWLINAKIKFDTIDFGILRLIDFMPANAQLFDDEY